MGRAVVTIVCLHGIQISSGIHHTHTRTHTHTHTTTYIRVN